MQPKDKVRFVQYWHIYDPGDTGTVAAPPDGEGRVIIAIDDEYRRPGVPSEVYNMPVPVHALEVL